MECHSMRLNLVTLTVLVACGVLHGAVADTEAPTLSTDDYVAIQQLYARFNTALDTGKAQQFADTWTDDGEFIGGRGPGRGSEVRTPIQGRAELVAMGQRAGVGTRHFVANLVLTPTAEGARATCYLVLLNARNSPPSITETAIYEDTLVRTAQGWKFRKRINWRDDDDISPYRPKPLTWPLP
jgi:hypothetical protein